LLGLLVSGCATVSPFNQDFLRVETNIFVIVSSFGEEHSRELARNLEYFHAGAMLALGATDDWRQREKTRVLAFDGRGMTRPFAVRAATAYSLSEPESGVMVFRAGGGWDRRTTRDLLHRYAHRVLRSRAPALRPLWLEEGLSQMAGSTELRGDVIRVGGLIPEFVREIQDWKSGTLAPVLEASDLSDESRGQRMRFEALSWSLVHFLRFGTSKDFSGKAALARLASKIDAEVPGSDRRAIDELGGDPELLEKRVYEHLDERRFKIDLIRPQGWDDALLEPEPLSRSRSRAILGRLALRLDRPALARDYFERALDADPEDAAALAGLVQADAKKASEPDALLARAAALAPDDARVQTWIGDAQAALAEYATEGSARTARIEAARARYRRSLEIDPAGVDARVGLGLTYLSGEEDVADGIAWLESAAQLRPGSLPIVLAIGQLEVRRGRRIAARIRAREVISRSHDAVLLESAQSLLEQVEAR
jgi:tetratricopeptide (TPR) repeat protein